MKLSKARFLGFRLRYDKLDSKRWCKLPWWNGSWRASIIGFITVCILCRHCIYDPDRWRISRKRSTVAWSPEYLPGSSLSLQVSQ